MGKLLAGKLNAITGATGLLGSHIAEKLRAAGERVRALVRPESDTTFLKKLGVELHTGQLADAASMTSFLSGADVVYHCAAKVSDWGPWKSFEDEAVAPMRILVEACKKVQVPRLLHVSSISAYGHPKTAPITEDTPLGQRFWLWDYYPRSKFLAEQIAWEYKSNLTVVRPSWIYGPRDRVTIPRVVSALRNRKVTMLGSGDNLLNIIFAGDVADGAILAANTPAALGQAYNLCSEGEVTQRQLLGTLTTALNLPPVKWRFPFRTAMKFAFLSECWYRLIRSPKPPTVTRRAIYLIGRPTQFTIAKARKELGWQPKVRIDEGVRVSLDWYHSQEKSA